MECSHKQIAMVGHHRSHEPLFTGAVSKSGLHTFSSYWPDGSRQCHTQGNADVRLADRLAAAFRGWEQAAEALDQSRESEEVQAVGMRCREALLAFVRSVSNPDMVPAGEDKPQVSNFVRWSELLAEKIAQGPKNERIRGYLKALAKESWQLVSWLTHATNATRHDGMIALDATHTILEAFGAALIRYERQPPERCERCGSLQVTPLYRPELQSDGAICQSCGWEKLPNEEPDAPAANSDP